MTEKDVRFFEKHWGEWIRRNPPPAVWTVNGGSEKAYAWLEMPCRGFLGKLFFCIGKWLRKKSF